MRIAALVTVLLLAASAYGQPIMVDARGSIIGEVLREDPTNPGTYFVDYIRRPGLHFRLRVREDTILGVGFHNGDAAGSCMNLIVRPEDMSLIWDFADLNTVVYTAGSDTFWGTPDGFANYYLRPAEMHASGVRKLYLHSMFSGPRNYYVSHTALGGCYWQQIPHNVYGYNLMQIGPPLQSYRESEGGFLPPYRILGVDEDDDGVPDADDICPGGDDSIDSDEDGVPDFCDPCPWDDQNDADGDGVCGDIDVCPAGDDSLNQDGDSLPDSCDVCPVDSQNDADGDGLCESDDNCATTPNPNQSDLDEDGAGDVCDLDLDGDGVGNGSDNCSFDVNSDQSDFDGDGFGDVCDTDLDADGVLDSRDACVPSAGGAAINADGCGIAELCPCQHPAGGNRWKNHGSYVSCVAHTAEDFLTSGLITQAEKDATVSAAGESNCGHKNQ